MVRRSRAHRSSASAVASGGMGRFGDGPSSRAPLSFDPRVPGHRRRSRAVPLVLLSLVTRMLRAMSFADPPEQGVGCGQRGEDRAGTRDARRGRGGHALPRSDGTCARRGHGGRRAPTGRGGPPARTRRGGRFAAARSLARGRRGSAARARHERDRRIPALGAPGGGQRLFRLARRARVARRRRIAGQASIAGVSRAASNCDRGVRTARGRGGDVSGNAPGGCVRPPRPRMRPRRHGSAVRRRDGGDRRAGGGSRPERSPICWS